SITQFSGSNLFARANATGSANSLITSQTGNNQTSNIDLLGGSGFNEITVSQSGSDNMSDIDLNNADSNDVTHTQSAVADVATTLLVSSNNNTVTVVQN